MALATQGCQEAEKVISKSFAQDSSCNTSSAAERMVQGQAEDSCHESYGHDQPHGQIYMEQTLQRSKPARILDQWQFRHWRCSGKDPPCLKTSALASSVQSTTQQMYKSGLRSNLRYHGGRSENCTACLLGSFRFTCAYAHELMIKCSAACKGSITGLQRRQ